MGLFAINYFHKRFCDRCSQGFKHTSAIDAIVTLAAPPPLFVVLNLKLFETWSLGSNVNQFESLQSRGDSSFVITSFGRLLNEVLDSVTCTWANYSTDQTLIPSPYFGTLVTAEDIITHIFRLSFKTTFLIK